MKPLPIEPTGPPGLLCCVSRRLSRRFRGSMAQRRATWCRRYRRMARPLFREPPATQDFRCGAPAPRESRHSAKSSNRRIGCRFAAMNDPKSLDCDAIPGSGWQRRPVQVLLCYPQDAAALKTEVDTSHDWTGLGRNDAIATRLLCSVKRGVDPGQNVIGRLALTNGANASRHGWI